MAHATPHFILLPAYLGVQSLEEAFAHPALARVLWLEMLVNPDLELGLRAQDARAQAAMLTARRWYTTYRTLITVMLNRPSMPPDSGPIDHRQTRRFQEALRYAAAHLGATQTAPS